MQDKVNIKKSSVYQELAGRAKKKRKTKNTRSMFQL